MRAMLLLLIGVALFSAAGGCDGGTTTPVPPGPWCGSQDGMYCACDVGAGRSRCALTDGTWTLTCECTAPTDGALDPRDD